MEGRDITTVVFPNADVKIYLDADLEERARRRFVQNQSKNIECTYEEVLEDMRKRDENDMNKPYGALKKADDAILVDSTNLTQKEVVKKILTTFIKSKNLSVDITFKELYELTRKLLIITGTNLTKKQGEYFSFLTTPDMKLIDAIRISTSIPFYFTPYS